MKRVESLPKNKQTWKRALKRFWTQAGRAICSSIRSRRVVKTIKMAGVLFPCRWDSDPSFKQGKKTIITYSFATKKSKFNYGDDRVARSSLTQISAKGRRDIINLFDSISDYINVDFKKVKGPEDCRGPSGLDSTQSLTNQVNTGLVFMPLQIHQMRRQG